MTDWNVNKTGGKQTGVPAGNLEPASLDSLVTTKQLTLSSAHHYKDSFSSVSLHHYYRQDPTASIPLAYGLEWMLILTPFRQVFSSSSNKTPIYRRRAATFLFSPSFWLLAHFPVKYSSYSTMLKERSTIKGSVFIATTIDGFIARPDGAVDFLNAYHVPEEHSGNDGDMGFSDFLSTVDVIVMGRKSFEMVASFGSDLWAYGDTPVVVCTRQDSVDIPHYCCETVSCSRLRPGELMGYLESKGHRHAYIDGGITIQRFLEADLIEEMTLTRVPVILGSGIPLFCNLGKEVHLRHLKTKSYANGLVTTHYKVVG
jgi:dihydrofolate reductase